MCFLMMVCGQHQGCTKWLLLPLLWVVELHATHSAVPKPFHVFDGAYNFGGLTESSHSCSPPASWEGVFFSRYCSTWWHSRLWTWGRHWSWWFWYGDWVSGWWIYLHLVSGAHCYTITHLPWFHMQGINNNPLPHEPRCEVYFIFGPSCWRPWSWSWFHPHDPVGKPVLEASFDETDAGPSSVLFRVYVLS